METEERSNQTTAKIPKALANFFSVTEEINIGHCKQCKAKVKFSSKATSNLITHLKRCCPAEHKKYVDLKAITGKPHKRSISDQQGAMESFVVSRTKEKFTRNDIRQKGITKALINSVACDQLPLSVLESPTFRKLLETAEPKYSIPSRPTVRNTILPNVMQQMENIIQQELSTLNHIYITLDLWTNRNMASFVGMTVHFVNENWDLKSFVLAADSFLGRHTADNIANAYHAITNKFDIWNRVKRVVSDNASAMIKAFSVSLPNFVIELEDEQNDETEELDSEETELNMAELLAQLPERISCFAHTKQLCVRDGLQEPSFTKSFVGKQLGKISKIVNSIRKSTTASPFLRQKGLVLRAQNCTRWNSQLTMVQSVLKKYNFVNDALNLMGSNEKISNQDVLALNELVTVLTPFKEALQEVEGEKKVTSSSICPVVIGLQKEFESFSTKSFRYCNGLILTLKNSIQKRLTPFLDSSDNQIASLLDPRFKAAWIENEELKQSVVTRLKVLASAKQSAIEVVESQEEPKLDLTEKRPRLFGFINATTSASAISPSYPQNEIARYLEEQIISFNEDPLSYWKNNTKDFPILSQLAREFLGCTATSAPSERVFSIAGNFYTSDRSLLGTATFRSLMFIKCNQLLYDQVQVK